MFRIVKIKITFVTLITSYTNLATLKLDTHSSVQTLIDFTRTLLTFRFVIASMRSMVLECLDNFLCFSLSSRTSHYENIQCYFSVGLPRTVCAFVSLTLDSILQQYVPRKTVATFYLNYFLLLLWKILDQMISLDYYHPWFPWSSFTFQPVSFGQWNVVGFCREIDNICGAVRTCFDHMLSKFSGFSWERILFLKSACVNMVIHIQLQIEDTRTVFTWIRLGVLRI